MQRIHYAGGELVTGDAIAEALLGYAAALARQRTAIAVEIPVVGDDGRRRTASLLLGPASQLVAERLPGDEDLVDEEAAARLQRAIARSEPRPIVEGADGADHDEEPAADPATVTGEYDWPDPSSPPKG